MLVWAMVATWISFWRHWLRQGKCTIQCAGLLPLMGSRVLSSVMRVAYKSWRSMMSKEEAYYGGSQICPSST